MVTPRFPPPNAAQQEALGVVIGHHLTDGGFKSVYRATRTVDNTPVVVTVERPDEAATERAVLHRLSSAPPHPHMIQLLATLEHGGRAYGVISDAGVQEVFDILIDGGSLGEPHALLIVGQVVEGLRHMHRLGVANCDIKLENMMLDAEGHLRLIDFGLSRFAALNPTPHESIFDFQQPPSNRGTRSYAAPEVLRADAPLDTRAADMWSLGCLLFALTCGFFVFDVARDDEWRFRLAVNTQAAEASTVRALFGVYGRPCPLSEELIELLDGLLTIDPAARMTLDDVVASAWLSGFAFSPALERYMPLDPALGRVRGRMRLSTLRQSTRRFGRALRAIRSWYEDDIRLRPGHSGAVALAQGFYENAATLDAIGSTYRSLSCPSSDVVHFRSLSFSSSSGQHTRRNEARRLQLVEECVAQLRQLGHTPTPPPIVRQQGWEEALLASK